MKNLLNRKVELIAIPPKIFFGPDRSDWSAVLDLTGQVCLGHAKNSFIIIDRYRSDDLGQSSRSIDVDSNINNCISFSVVINRDIVNLYTKRARSILKDRLESKRNIEKIDIEKIYRSTKGKIFGGELARDLELKACSILVSSHLADPVSVSVSRIVSRGTTGSAASSHFKMNLRSRDHYAHDVALRTLSPKAVYDFIWARPDEIGGKPKSQFMRGISYISQTFNYSENPLTTFMWSLAAIEAMLSTSSDKANSGLLELRLKAILDMDNTDNIVGRFRNLYKYRNSIFHGNTILPYSFDSRNIFGFDDINHSNTAPFDIAAFTYALAIKILQRFFEMNKYDVKYDVVLAGAASKVSSVL